MDHFERARLKMVEEKLRARGIRDERVLAAMASLERHRFVNGPLQSSAYEDRALPIGLGQTISQPWIVALMSESLQLKGGERVLEIGTGSGYQAAVLSLLAGRVYTIERHAELLRRARLIFEGMGLKNIVSRCGDGSIGWEDEGPFDRIVVTAASPGVPEALARQLVIGGRLVVPVGDRKQQDLKIIDRHGETDFQGYSAGACAFVPLLGREGWPVGGAREDDNGRD